ncbi:MAG TPA: type IV secretion system DNA-binding domain-containing protein [Baekduia sp.]|nr:type IV secretion system DNA-binding domain-containing protein [Baekduia sp.]
MPALPIASTPLNGALFALWLAAIVASLAGGWATAWWLHHRTPVNGRHVIAAAACIATAGAVLSVTGKLGAMLGLPLVAAGVLGGRAAFGFRRRALGAGGELRQHELNRTSARAWLSERRDGRSVATKIGPGGELQTEREIRGPHIALDAAGELKVATGPGRHVCVCGQTGSGKTRTVEALLAHRIRSGAGAVVIDPKPDDELAEFLAGAAKAVGRPFYLIDPRHPDGVPYQPLADKDASTAADVAASGYDFTEPHYLVSMQLHLDVVAKVIEAHTGSVTLPLLAELSGDTGEARIQQWATGTALELATERHYAELTANRVRREAVAAAVTRMRGIANRGWQGAWQTDENGRAMSLLDALRERAIVLFRPVAALGDREAEIVTAMILADLAVCATRLHHELDDWVAFVDEVSAVLGGRGMEALISLYQRARSGGGQLIVATQSIADFEAFTENPSFTDSLAENFSTIVAHTQVSQSSREWLAMHCGTRELWQSTDRTVGHGMQTEGSGSARRAAEFLLHPDELHQLGVGEAVVYTPPALPARGRVQLIPRPPQGPLSGRTGAALRAFATPPADYPTGEDLQQAVPPAPTTELGFR